MAQMAVRLRRHHVVEGSNPSRGVIFMDNLEELTVLAKAADKILKEELARASLEHDLAEVKIYDKKRVGVKGDARVYGYNAEITLKLK